jgi:hypothetical protein
MSGTGTPPGPERTSVQLPPATRDRLVIVAGELTMREGRRVTLAGALAKLLDMWQTQAPNGSGQ